MYCSNQWTEVHFDASPIFRFGEAGQIVALASYTKDRGVVAREVEVEIQRHEARIPALQALKRMPTWPAVRVLPNDLQVKLVSILAAVQEPGDHPKTHAGEVATVLLAERDGGGVVLDDRFGKKLAKQRSIPRLSTAQLAVEMMVATSLDEESARAVWDYATPAEAGEADFKRAVKDAESACSGS